LLRRGEGKGGKGWDGEGRERKGEEGRDGKRAGGKYCFMAVGGGWTPLEKKIVYFSEKRFASAKVDRGMQLESGLDAVDK
jgi:hypothetical protein